MSDINLTNGEAYVFAKIDNKPVILSGTDDAHLDSKVIRTDIIITGSLSVTGDISGSTFISSGSSTSEGGELQLLPKTNGNKVWLIDNYDEDLRIFRRDLDNPSVVVKGIQISSSGDVGIGTEFPIYPLHVKSNTVGYIAKFENTSNDTSTSDGVIISIGPDASGSMTEANKWITFQDGNGTYMGAIQGNGGSGPELSNVSDRKLKRDIVTTEYGITELLNLEVVDFKWKSSGKSSTGFIAQQVEEIYPQVVSKPSKPEIPYSMNYAGLSPLIVKAIQDQNKIIEDLKSRICELEKDK